jgi:hypothetical protein
MMAKFGLGLLATLGIPVLLASALAQQSGGEAGRAGHGGQSIGASAAPAANPTGENFNWSSADANTLRDDGVNQPLNAYSIVTDNLTSEGRFLTLTSPAARNAENTLAHRADELARKLGGAKSETDRSQIKTELTDVLEKQFDLRQKRHHDEIAALESKVKKLKDLVERRQENRREIIAKRVDQILRDAEGLGW